MTTKTPPARKSSPEPSGRDLDSEPRYVDDPWEEADQGRPKWQIPPVDDTLLATAMDACGRKYFQSHQERKMWKEIRQAVVARQMSAAWVTHCCEYASQKQRMPFPNLLKWIGNTDKMRDWEARQSPRPVETAASTPEQFHGKPVSLVEEHNLKKQFGDAIVVVDGIAYARSKIKGYTASGKPVFKE